MRTIAEIKTEMTDSFIADITVIEKYGLTEGKTFEQQFSKVSIESILFYIVAVAIWALESLFNMHASEVDAKLAELTAHTARWYRNKALAFQYGFNLIEDTDNFNNTDFEEEQIEASKIIKYSAVVEAENESRLIVKIASETNNELSPVGNAQLEAFTAYINAIKDAGVPITVINYLPDLLKLNIRIVRDPLVLDANGMNIITAKKPVNDAIRAFMKELPFNGKLSLQAMIDKLQLVEGVQDLSLDLAQTAWIDGSEETYGNYTNIDISTIPVSGYFTVNLDDTENANTLSEISYV